MKPTKLLITGMISLLIVSATLAKKFSHKDLLVCNANTGLCELQGPDTSYSTFDNNQRILPDEDVFTGAAGKACYSMQCPEYTGIVYTNP